MTNVFESLAEKIIGEGLAWKKEFFDWWESRGVHITPVHFYSAIPDVSKLDDSLWSKVSALPGINMREAGQVDYLETVCPKYKREYERFPLYSSGIPYQYHHDQPMFRAVDAEILHCFVRHYKPKSIIEVGSGFSTYVTAAAAVLNKNEGASTSFTAVEPYPNEVIMKGLPGLTELLVSPVQDVPVSRFELLQKGDILFIDSSHVVKIGSDVLFLFLEVLPRLREGVLVHIHDIFLPAEYPKEWVVNEHRFRTEQYLLQAFLVGNDNYDVLWGGSYMHLKHSLRLVQHFPAYDKIRHWPGSFWIVKK